MIKAKEIVVDVNDLRLFHVKQYFNLIPNRRGNPGNSKKTRYYDEFITFDIETSKIKDIEQSFMYIWQCCIAGEVTVVGRTWEEFKQLLDIFINEFEHTIVCYVHNLSFEFSFLKGVLEFGEDSVFASDSRSIIKATYFNIEFRCSYFLTNTSLDKFTQDMNVYHTKQSGDDFNYDIVRTPGTALTKKELYYCLCDVWGLWEAVKTKMIAYGDNISTIPLTSTGYVRRDIKKAMHVTRRQVQDIFPDYSIYKILRWAFRGGDTHANRYYSGVILPDVYSYDRVSSYPDVLVNCRFPVTPFIPENPTIERLVDLIEIHHKAALMTVSFTGIACKDDCYCPYIPFDKCRASSRVIKDNGRVLSADYIEISITDIDWNIIMREYRWETVNIQELFSSRYGYLPRPIIDSILKYYSNKTSLKNVENRELDYQLFKALLNAIYGLMAQNPVKYSLLYDSTQRVLVADPLESAQEILEQAKNKSYVAYQWGVWCTAWARFRLHEMIWLVGDSFVYCDTDSVKCIGNHDNVVSKYNEERLRDSKQSGAFAKSRKGSIHFMGIYELDGHYEKFCTLGAKKYCYLDEYGLHITISGVQKKAGAVELGCIENFKPDFVFHKSAGLKAKYNDNVDFYCVVNGEKIHVTDNVYLSDTEYTLGITDEYRRIINYAQQYYISPIDRELR